MAVQQLKAAYLQIVRSTALRLLLATVTLIAAACEKDPDPQIRISAQELLLPGDTSGNATFTVTADAAWGLTYSGEGFSVSPSSGSAGETTVTVSPTEANTEKKPRPFGGAVFICRKTLPRGKTEADPPPLPRSESYARDIYA